HLLYNSLSTRKAIHNPPEGPGRKRLEDATNAVPSSPLSRFRRLSNDHREKGWVVSCAVGETAPASPYGDRERDEKLNQQGTRVGFRVRFDRPHDFAGQPMEAFGSKRGRTGRARRPHGHVTLCHGTPCYAPDGNPRL